MPITITATDAGFHFLDAIGGEVAPDAFLVSRLNPNGVLFQTNDGARWQTEESFLNPIVSVEVSLAREAALPPGPRAGDETQLALAGLTFSRNDNQGSEIIGEIAFDGIMTVDAVFHPNGASAIGQGASPNWIVEMGTLVLERVETQGYEFAGSDARDIFAPGRASFALAARGEIRGFGGDDDLIAQTGGAKILGGQGDDFISAEGGRNTAWGGSGDDHIDFAELSVDQRAFGGRGSDLIAGGAGDDLVKGGSGRDRLYGGEGADIMKGGGGSDRLIGGEGADRLIGNAGRDLLKGGLGADTLIGGAGDDKLRGGRGEDVFLFTARSGDDVITDFEIQSDNIDFAIDGIARNDILFEDTETGVLLTIAGQEISVLLLGVTATEIADQDFLL